ATGILTTDHHTLAAVVEIVHMATLVHDDVLDGADERRGQKPVNAISGNVAAVLLGDYLVSHAYHLCSGLDDQYAARRIAATANVVCEGELLQNELRGDVLLTEQAYLAIVERKTAALTATSCELGARFSGADPAVVQVMQSFGRAAGVAFQIIDDVLDIVGDRNKVRKTLGSDLALGKPTLPTIHCLASARTDIAESLRAVLAGEAPGSDCQLRRWLEDTGSLDYAVSVAEGYVRDALSQLEAVPMSDARSSLTAIAEFIAHRQF
ncbi:MAG: polyprenyl synthetase family protein, partial [Planctomycetes bacterium]|nr:polyprenyl synthetase family protein [Planctomycetota bacterium]